MANWKKVLVSGSDAALAQLNVDNAVTASYFKGDGSALTGVAATSLDIDNFGSDLTSATLIGSDKIIVSDDGTEGRTTISKLASPLQGNAITESGGTLNLNVDTSSFEIASNALAIKAGGVGGTDFADNVVSESLQIAADISGSLGANATLIRSLTAAGISGSLGANATLIRSLTAASISGSFNSVSASIASDIAGLDGDFATDAELNAATASLSSSLATDIATNLSSITTLEGKTLFSGSEQITITAGDLSGSLNNITVTAVQNVSLTSNEVTQIANIGDSTSISATQWGYVGNFDQNLSTANNVTFTDLSLDGDLAINTDKFTVANLTGNTSIGGTLSVTGNVTAAANVTVTGDLTVNGTTTTVNTSNLEVEDRFIFLNEGSGSANPAGEGGIIVEGSTAGQGEAFYYDGNSSRWSVASDVSKTATSATPDAFAAIAHVGTPAEATTAGYNQNGNLTVTLGGDIYIYA